ncbi:MAG: alanyl-tRNA synthetase [Cellvibrionaceae bacterium]|jgi:alanyl-tRNA synthetase
MKTSNEIREAFLSYYEKAGHERVESAPLPQKDNPTLLFNNAGMNQFANVFIGLENRPYSRAVTSQKCMRVSGKHNDLENVGPSPRHHTFFEMLGNFSFGDYFKKDAIKFAWEFLTEELQLDKSRLWISIYTDDDEAFELWQEHVPANRILRFGKEENFWEMGDIGPCGPCSEIHYYIGEMEDMVPEGVNVEDDYLEIWNLVFMQFEKDASGTLTPLPKPSIDTGMGLERITQVLQHKTNNYDTDLFTSAMDAVQELLRHTDEDRDENYVGYRVIADHVRAATFLIADGVRPGNDGPDYVLRMVMRRAARFGREIGFTEPFMAHVAEAFIQQMGGAYPELRQKAENIKYTLTREEENFETVLDRATVHLERILNNLREKEVTEIPGETAFDLHQTYGLPIEITRDIAQEQKFTIDEAGFLDARAAHKLASGAGAFKGYDLEGNIYTSVLQDLQEEEKLPNTGVQQAQYDAPRMASQILAILKEGERSDIAREGDRVEIVTVATPFYAESGGQVSDIGTISVATKGAQFRVEGMLKPKGVDGLILHAGTVVQGEIEIGDTAMLRVDNQRRSDIRRNHTATHILHEELRRHLGKHVSQAGSLVSPDRLRFDFTHGESVGAEQLSKIENDINHAIGANYPVSIKEMEKNEAISHGAMALFGEKYGDTVRTVKIGNSDSTYSFELCGGLHVPETNDINQFIFLNEGSVSAGVRRVEAITGRAAREYVTEKLNLINRLSTTLSASSDEIEGRLESLLNENRDLKKEIDNMKKESLVGQLDSVLEQTVQVAGVNLLTAVVEGADSDGLRDLTDRFKDRAGSGVAVLGAVKDGRPLLVVAVTNDLIERGLHAGNIIREIAKMIGGGGGGRPNLAQAGGKDASKLPEALAAVPNLIENSIKD